MWVDTWEWAHSIWIFFSMFVRTRMTNTMIFISLSYPTQVWAVVQEQQNYVNDEINAWES